MPATAPEGALTTEAPEGAFTAEQKEYLSGFAAGLSARGLFPFVGHRPDGRITHAAGEAPANLAAPPAEEAETVFGVPIDELSKEERFKWEENPLDIWDKIVRHAAEDRPPEGGDVFRFKFHGLFYVAPAQDAFMLRVRVPGSVLTSRQMRGLAHIARAWGGGYADVTTRSNLQIREFAPRNVVNVLMALADLGITSRGSGADNVRNLTATPTSGLDPTEIYDVRPLARGLQFYLNNSRDLFGLPRKFNVAFDSGGAVSVVSDTNDIGFVATRAGPGAGVEPGVYFRVLLAGVTGHKRFATDSGLLLKPEECVAAAAAMIRVFAEKGDRTDRKKARLCYVLDRIGVAGFLEETQKKLGFPLRYAPADKTEPRRPVVKHGHLGIHAQTQPGLNYIGVAIPVGRMSTAQMEALADLADACGSGELRLTVWQNVIVPDVPDAKVEAAKDAIRAMGYDWRASGIASGLVACTGNTGCRFASTNTKGQAVALGDYLHKQIDLDEPINIHLTGCPNSCAQHYISDIGLLGTKVETASGAVEGYHVYVGGGSDQDQGLGRAFAKNIPFAELPPLLESLLKGYGAHRAPGESFLAFARRHTVDELQAIAGEKGR
ncbi:MAG: NirA family protein [Allosphingosinicella sp.]